MIKKQWLVLLDDGETYANLAGCKVIEVSEDDLIAMETRGDKIDTIPRNRSIPISLLLKKVE